jgi:UDPglucose 6-dehydrogenase
MQRYHCAVIGDWHLAFVTAASLSSLGHKIALINPDSGNREWKEFPKPPVSEPGLSETIAQGLSEGRLFFENGISSDWSADFIWLAIDTPVSDSDEPDTKPLRKVAEAIAQHSSQKSPFLISSQIPLGFSEELEKNFGLKVVYIPENLRLGKGMETFLSADRTVLGASDSDSRAETRKFLAGLKTQFLECDLPTAEMIKHATNAFLATSISFANELARIGESKNVDNQLVGKALKLDSRIGKQAYVLPGLGFAGGTLPRDLRVLQSLGREAKIPTELIDSVLNVNERTTVAIASAVRSTVGSLRGKKILVLGYTYKADTDTLRRSLSLDLGEMFSKEGASVWGWDPVMNDRDLSLLQGKIEHYSRWEDFPATPDVILLMTPRKQFLELDWKGLRAKSPQSESLVFDTHGFLTPGSVLENGFSFKILWQPVQKGKRL